MTEQIDNVAHGDLYITTVSGNKICLPNPDIENIEIDDIARQLSRNCRFNGCCNKFYSISQHSIFVGWLASVAMHDFFDSAYKIYGSEEWAVEVSNYWAVPSRVAGKYTTALSSDSTAIMEGLMHDAHEAYLGDCISPVKKYLGEKYKELERGVDNAVRVKFGLASKEPDFINMVDKAALVLEGKYLMPQNLDIGRYVQPASMSFAGHIEKNYPFYGSLIMEYMDSEVAYERFMTVYNSTLRDIHNEM
jgi:uncharacterized protein